VPKFTVKKGKICVTEGRSVEERSDEGVGGMFSRKMAPSQVTECINGPLDMQDY